MDSKQLVGKFSQVASQMCRSSLALALGVALLPAASFAGESYIIYQKAKNSAVSGKGLVTRVDAVIAEGSILTIKTGKQAIPVRFFSSSAAQDAAQQMMTGQASIDLSGCAQKAELKDRALETSSRRGNYQVSRTTTPYALTGFECAGIMGLARAKLVSAEKVNDETHQELSIDGAPVVSWESKEESTRVAGLDFSK